MSASSFNKYLLSLFFVGHCVGDGDCLREQDGSDPLRFLSPENEMDAEQSRWTPPCAPPCTRPILSFFLVYFEATGRCYLTSYRFQHVLLIARDFFKSNLKILKLKNEL